MSIPKISILIPCYNAETWLRQCIESALSQTYPNKEIILIDDGSTDGSLEVVKAFGSNVQWESSQNCGSNITRNKLLRKSSGEWVQYLDADDYMKKEKLICQMNLLGSRPDLDVIYSPVQVEEVGKRLRAKHIYTLNMPSKDDIYINFARWGPIQTAGILWKRESLLSVGGWKEEQKVCQEHELILRLIINKNKFSLLDRPLSVYRRTSSETLSTKNKLLTIQNRMILTDLLEGYLGQSGGLISKRQFAINLSRFECARDIYGDNKQLAKELIEKINHSDKHFIPTGPAAPHAFRFIYRLLGFERSQEAAEWMRRFK